MTGQNDLPHEKEGMNNKNAPLSDIWYTFQQVMELFERKKSTINRWRNKKGLICSKIDGLVLFNKTDVDNFRLRHRGLMLLIASFSKCIEW